MTSTVFLRRIHIFREFLPEEIDSIQHIFHEKEYKKNQVVFLEEETGEYMYIVKYGEVKVVQSSPDGRENILAIHHTGDTFGEMALLDGKTIPATVVAKEDCKIIHISKDSFVGILLKNPKITQSLLQLFCQRLRESWRTIRALKYTDAETRLKHVILELSQTDGSFHPRGVRLNLRITHQELAEMMGVSRETVSRQISRWQQDGLLFMEDRRYLIPNHPFWSGNELK